MTEKTIRLWIDVEGDKCGQDCKKHKEKTNSVGTIEDWCWEFDEHIVYGFRCPTCISAERKANERQALEQENDELAGALETKDELLACYRLGRQPSEQLFKKLGAGDLALAKRKERKRV